MKNTNKHKRRRAEAPAGADAKAANAVGAEEDGAAAAGARSSAANEAASVPDVDALFDLQDDDMEGAPEAQQQRPAGGKSARIIED